MERDAELVDVTWYEWGYVVNGHRVLWRKPICDNRIAYAMMDEEDRELMIQRERWDDRDKQEEEMLTPAQQNELNITKLSELTADAHAKREDSGTSVSGKNYWHGFEDGLKRAIMVLQGRG